MGQLGRTPDSLFDLKVLDVLRYVFRASKTCCLLIQL